MQAILGAAEYNAAAANLMLTEMEGYSSGSESDEELQQLVNQFTDASVMEGAHRRRQQQQPPRAGPPPASHPVQQSLLSYGHSRTGDEANHINMPSAQQLSSSQLQTGNQVGTQIGIRRQVSSAQHGAASSAAEDRLHRNAPAGPEDYSAAPEFQHVATPTDGRHAENDMIDSMYDDKYHQHRGPALKLTRQWQKLVRRSAAAYAAGDHSGTPLQ